DGKEAAKFADLPQGTEDIWSLVYDEKNKVVYAATGPEGKIFRIDQNGKEQVYFDSDEAHIWSLALASDGTLYAGSNGKALLYKITGGGGKAAVLYDFDTDDVRALAIDSSGSLYAIANKYTESFAPPKRKKTGLSGPSGSKPGRPGK